MNGAATFGDELWRAANAFCGAQSGRFGDLALGETMTSAVAAFGIAVGGASLICYLLMTRVQNGKRNLRSSGDSPTPDGGSYAAGDGWTLANWFGSGHSALDSSGNPGDFGAGDSGGGGDGGGDGGGGD
jgi:hypothetical protein